MKAGTAGRQVRVAIHTLDFGAYSSAGQSTRLISVGSMVQIHLGPVPGGSSSAGRAPALQAGGRRFEPGLLQGLNTDFRSLKNQAQMSGLLP